MLATNHFERQSVIQCVDCQYCLRRGGQLNVSVCLHERLTAGRLCRFSVAAAITVFQETDNSSRKDIQSTLLL